MKDQGGQPQAQIHEIAELRIEPRTQNRGDGHDLCRTLCNAAAACHIAFDGNLGGNGFHDLHDGDNRTVADKVIGAVDADKHLCLLPKLEGAGIILRNDNDALFCFASSKSCKTRGTVKRSDSSKARISSLVFAVADISTAAKGIWLTMPF